MNTQLPKLKLEELYHLRNNFVVIGLTGKNSSGCSKVAKLLTHNEFVDFWGNESSGFSDFNTNIDIGLHNNQRKFRIVYNYLKHNWKPFKLISYNQVLMYLVLNQPFESLISFLDGLSNKLDFSDEVMELYQIKAQYTNLQKKRLAQLHKIHLLFTQRKRGKFDISKNILLPALLHLL